MSERPGPTGSTPGDTGSYESTAPYEQFTVPVPAMPSAPSGPSAPSASATQALPVAEPTRELPVSPPAAVGPPVPQNPYAGGPAWPAPTGSAWASDGPGTGPVEAIDPLLGQIGAALFWITVGWWLFFLIRVLGWLTRFGMTDTILIRTIDLGAEETVVAAVLSVLAALLLLLGRGRAGRRSPLGIASSVLAVLTVGVAVWRLVP